MSALYKYLKPKEVDLNQLLLDPNNPRFAELNDENEQVVERRFAEDSVQKKAYEKMKAKNFDVVELRDTIKTLGFLPMDKIVVRKWSESTPENEKYVIVEGNRRVTAMKWLLELHADGKGNLTEDQIENLTHLEVLLLDDENATPFSKWVLPGLRHVSGIKAWGPYQRGRTVFELREAGYDAQTAAQSLGLSTRAANALWRSYLALAQMMADEEFGERANPRLYSYFEEVFKKGEIRDWLEWSDNDRKFKNEARIREFYSWIVGTEEDGEEGGTPKLPEAKSVRELGQIITDEAAMTVFRGQNGSLTRATARFISDHPDDWKPSIESAITALKSLPSDTVRRFDKEDLKVLDTLSGRIDQVLKDNQLLNRSI